MANKVIKNFRDKTDKKKLYKKGNVYESKDSKRIAFLIEQGYVEAAKIESTELNHVGGGYYELPNGEKVKGKNQALAALKDVETRGE